MIVFILLACASTPQPSPSTTVGDTAAEEATTDTSEDSGEPQGIDPAHAEGISLVAEDAETYAGFEYRLQTFEVTKAHAQPMVTAEGSAPRFHVFAPVNAAAARPLLVILHGGSMDVDTAEAPAGLQGRCQDSHGASYGDKYTLTHPAAILGAAQGWVVVVPENGFCDGWTGTGLSEPTDRHHGGFALISAAVDYLRFGQDAFAIDDAHIVAMGHSAGARGATYFAARYPDVSALVFDSGASDVVRYYSEDEYTTTNTAYLKLCLEHNLGSPPYVDAEQTVEGDAWARYRDLGLVQALEAQRVPVPIFHVFNTLDGTSPPVQHEDIGPLLSARQIRYAQLDTNRHTPAHPQIAKSWPPAHAALRFGLGAQVAFVEGETGEGDLGRETRENVYFDTTARTAIPGDGPGVLVRLPLSVDAIGPIEVVPVLYGDSESPEEAVTVSLSGPDGVVSVSLRADQLLPPSAEPALVAPYIEAATLSASGPLTMTVTVTGVAEVSLDTVALSWMN